MATLRSSRSLTLAARGKMNLALEVLGVLPDGYHALDTVFCTLELSDVLHIEASDQFRLEVLWEGPRPVSLPQEDNLVSRALRLLEKSTGQTIPASLKLVKRLPAAGGLGGGSADAAAALIGLNRLFELGLPEAALGSLAASLGADVAFCLRGGTARGRGRGDRLERLPPAPALEVVLVCPPLGCSTPEVYAAWDRRVRPPATGASQRMVEALEQGNSEAIVSGVANDLEPAAVELYPELHRLRESMLQAGCVSAVLSGSGSTLVGFPAGSPQEVARRLERQVSAEVHLTRLEGTGR
ncbi:MAG: 4-(cytidine 5'-diphospho)-2-C-methyl-D-erythritol kinase [Armatimonadetes bacterium]|nr:4-(cytidine 5'-diphospho)-2-C-methyl-D-erythritol kinase [Armatimonadota bacterium]